MDKKDEQLVAQDAPLKNTDRAYVEVGKDGEPVMPAKEEGKEKQEEKPKPGLENR